MPFDLLPARSKFALICINYSRVYANWFANLFSKLQPCRCFYLTLTNKETPCFRRFVDLVWHCRECGICNCPCKLDIKIAFGKVASHIFANHFLKIEVRRPCWLQMSSWFISVFTSWFQLIFGSFSSVVWWVAKNWHSFLVGYLQCGCAFFIIYCLTIRWLINLIERTDNCWIAFWHCWLIVRQRCFLRKPASFFPASRWLF